tara:strand:- start:305 stop:565 length:261 start_codon:yes stop_codon:yes gene_type:complete
MNKIKIKNTIWLKLETGFYSVQKHKGTKYLLAGYDMEEILDDNVCDVECLADLTKKQYRELEIALKSTFNVELNNQGLTNRSLVTF